MDGENSVEECDRKPKICHFSKRNFFPRHRWYSRQVEVKINYFFYFYY